MHTSSIVKEPPMFPFRLSPRQRRVVPALVVTLTLLALASGEVLGVIAAAADAPSTPRLAPVDQWFGESRALSVDGDVIYYGVGRSIAVANYDENLPNGIRLDRRTAPIPLPAPDAPPAPITDVASGQPGVWAVTGQAEDGVAFFDFRGPVLSQQDLQLVGRIVLDAGEAPLAVAAIGDEAIVAVGDPAGVRQGGIVLLRADAAGVPHVVGRWRDPMGTRGLFVTSDVQWNVDSGHLLVGGSGDGQALVRLDMRRSADGTAAFDVVGRHVEPVAFVQHLAEDVDHCTVYGIWGDGQHTTGAGGLYVFDVCGESAGVVGGIKVLGQVRSPEGVYLPLTGVAAGTVGIPTATVADAGGGIWAIRTASPNEMTWPRDPLVAPLTALPACGTTVFAHDANIFTAGCRLRVVETQLDGSNRPMPRIVRTATLPHVPVIDRPYVDEPRASRVAAANGRLYHAVADTLSIIDPRAAKAPGAAAPAVTGQVALPVDPSGVAQFFQMLDLVVGGDVAWVTPTEGPLTAVDVRDPQRPRVIGHIDGLDATVLAAGAGLLAVMADDGSAAPLKLFDVTDPAAARPVGAIDIKVPWYGDLAIEDGRLFVAAGAEGLHILDIRVPADRRVIATESVHHATALAVANADANGDELLVTVGDRELSIYRSDSVTDPDRRPVRLSAVDLPIPAVDVAVLPQLSLVRSADRLIAVVLLDRWLVAVDITDPTEPVAGRPYRMAGSGETMAVLEDRAHVWGRGLGAEMTVFEVSALVIARTLQLPMVLNGGW